MSANVLIATQRVESPPVMPRNRVLRIYLAESKFEAVRLLRAPTFIVPILLLPLLFYLFFGVFMAKSVAGDISSEELFIGWMVYGVIGPALLTFGIVLAVERQYGLLTFKRALPMPPASYLFSKLMMALVFGLAVMVLLLVTAELLGQVRFSATQMVNIALVSFIGIPPACAIGLFIGVSASTQTAPAIANFVYFGMAGLSGLFSPLPAMLQWITPIWPSHHYKQLGLIAAGVTDGNPTIHIVALVGMTALFCLLAQRRLRKMGDRLT